MSVARWVRSGGAWHLVGGKPVLHRYIERIGADGGALLAVPGEATDRLGGAALTLGGGAAFNPAGALLSGEPGAVEGGYASTDAGTRRNLITRPQPVVTWWGHALTNATNNGSGLNGGAAWDSASGGSHWYINGTATSPATALIALGANGTSLYFDIAASTQYTFSFEREIVQREGAGSVALYATFYDAGGAVVSASTLVATDAAAAGTRGRFSGTFISPVGAVRVRFYWGYNGGLPTGQTFEAYAADALLEQAASAGPHFDGSGYVNGAGTWVPSAGIECGWLGTPHESASDKGPLGNGKPVTYGGVAKRTNQAAAHTLLGGSVASNATRLVCASGSDDVLWIVGGTTYTFSGAWFGTDRCLWALSFGETADTADLWVWSIDTAGAFHEHKTGVTAQHAAGQTLLVGAHGAGSDPIDGAFGSFWALHREHSVAELDVLGAIGA